MTSTETNAETVTEYAISDGSDKPEHLGDMTREQAEAELAEQRRIWDELPLKLVWRTVSTTPWADSPAAEVSR
jgi:hypothetical protein